MGCVGSKATSSKEQERHSSSDGHKGEVAPSTMQTEEQALDNEADMPAPLRQSVYRGRRGSVSAEVKSFSIGIAEARGLRKSLNTEDSLVDALKHCFLFQDLDDDQKQDVIGAMFRRNVFAGEIIIREGEAADNLYVIQSGIFEAYKVSEEGERVLFKYEEAGAFGELALMYNCPRAATVRAVTSGVLWAMDRSTFRTIVLGARVQKRRRYEEVLADMAIFQSLTPANRSSIADCLTAEVYQEGEYILKEGEPLATESKFYIIEEGAVECCKTILGSKKSVGTMGPGRFFGELALVRQNSTRAADCIARARTKVLTLSRDAFERLMGPAEKILAEQVAQYDRANSDASFTVNRNPRVSFV